MAISTNRELGDETEKRLAQSKVLAASLLGLIAIGFSDLTSTIATANDVNKGLIGFFITTIFVTALGLGYSWPYLERIKKSLANQSSSSLDHALRKRFYAARIYTSLSVASMLGGAGCYLVAVWQWA